MAHTFLKAEKIVNLGLGLLARDLVLQNIVTTYRGTDFVGALDDQIKIPIPSLLAGREYAWRNDRSSPIVVDDLTEQKIAFTMNHHMYSAVAVTDEQLTLDIKSFAEQVARPQIRAVGEKLEGLIATAMTSANYKNTVPFVAPSGDANDKQFYRTAVRARKYLNQENVPGDNRYILVGADVEEAVLNSKQLVEADKAGTSGAFREAIIGRIAGFTVITNNSVPANFAVAFHPTAFGFANLAPDVPEGVAKGATTSYEGLAMRWIKDYDAPYLRDRSVYSSFGGAISVEDGRNMTQGAGYGTLLNKNVRAVRIDYTAGS